MASDPGSAWRQVPFEISKPPSVQTTLVIAPDSLLINNFPRSAKWSPDGSVILSQCENRTLQIFETNVPGTERYKPSRIFTQSSPILDFLWYPTATPQDPAAYCFVASVRECPVKLLDASDGRLRASYRIVDHRERQIAPHSLAFNLTAQKLYCGFEDAIEVFDLSRPGEGNRLHTTPSKKSKDGLKGIVSALAFSPSYSPDESFYAAGTFTPNPSSIAMFSDAQEGPLMFVGGGPYAGVTQLAFNPMKPHMLYAAYRGRGSGSIYSWDIRSNVEMPLEILRIPAEKGINTNTNQKRRFDIDLSGRLLGYGDGNGNISVFNLEVPEETISDDGGDTNIRGPTLHFQAHDDAIGSVAFHPSKPSLLSVSGSRHFDDNDPEDISSESEEDDLASANVPSASSPTGRLIRRGKRPQPVTLDSSIKIWTI
ncbi:WD40-repeat-containing domain protein [Crassisporium funariophilum]|nr:WD40-repeat-containing domain protein [Crassisporium funariophilum]